MSTPAARPTKAERELKKYLRDLSAAVTAHLSNLDHEMTNEPDSVERGKRIARSANSLDLVNDRVRYFALGVNFRTDDKQALAARVLVGKEPDA